MVLMTEFDFILPCGYVGQGGALYRKGKMRLATAADEILPKKNPRVVDFPDYIAVEIMSRVLTRLGSETEMTTDMVEKFFVKDMAFLSDMYEWINGLEGRNIPVRCSRCGKTYEIPLLFTEDTGEPLKTEQEFELPEGYLAEDGSLHKKGVMRLARLEDELSCKRDRRCRNNPDYLTILLLSRVVQLEGLPELTPEMVEGIFVRDLTFLNLLYEEMNGLGMRTVEGDCPECGMHQEVPINFPRRA